MKTLLTQFVGEYLVKAVLVRVGWISFIISYKGMEIEASRRRFGSDRLALEAGMQAAEAIQRAEAADQEADCAAAIRAERGTRLG